MAFGLPLEVNGRRYKNILEDQSEQQEYIREYQRNVLAYIESMDGDLDVKPNILSYDVTQEQFQALAEEDTQWAVFSVLFVYIYLAIHLKSMVLALHGVLLIIFSFAMSAIINQGIFRNTFNSTLHSLVIFIVLGIAADDIFVFVDGWSQSKSISLINDDRRKRLAYSFRRAARATLTTSSTTSVAFLANAFSPIMPIASFGIYAGIIISVNYLLIILLFPPMVIWYEDHLLGKWCLCGEKKEETTQITDLTTSQKRQTGTVEAFFEFKWNDFVFAQRYLIVGLFFVWTVVAVYFAVQLSPTTKQEQFLPDDHPIEVVQEISNTKFSTGGLFELSVTAYWGVSGIDKSEVSRWDATYIGEAIMDPDFDLSPVEAQQSLLDLCADLVEQDFVLDRAVTCWTT
mmetsp:Transcript_4511/g.7685  ORF Transcript_4511/g.7685 Transcript_4511/m.7685 type:complete len:401 (+) Transcript_4511:884-2086(+)